MTDVTSLTYAYDETSLEYATEVTYIDAAGIGPPGPSADNADFVTDAELSAAIAAAIDAIVAAAPGTLDTLDELAGALGNDPDFATTIATLIGTKVAKSLYDAHTVLVATSDDTPVALTIDQATMLGRLTGGNIAALTTSQIRTLLSINNVDNTSDVNKPVSTAQQSAIDAKVADSITDSVTSVAPSQNAVYDALALKLDASALDTSTDLDGNSASNSKVPSQAAVKAYADSLIAANDAMVFKGVIDCSTNPDYPVADRGHVYKVSVAGKIGGASGPNVEIGDMAICITDGTSTGNHAAVGANWSIIQVNVDGWIAGPASATSGNLPSFSGTTGKLIQDSGVAVSTDGTFASNSDAKLPTEKAVKTALDLKAPLASPALTGNPTAPTQSASDNSTKIATTAYVDTAAGLLVPKSLYDANTVLYATTDNTPAALTVAASTFVGRKSTGDISAMSASESRTVLGLSTSDSPQFTAVEIGHATDTTLARSGAGDLTVEGNALYRAGGTDVPVADGGTGGSTAAAAAVNLSLIPVTGWIEDTFTRTGNYTFTVARDTTRATGDGSIDKGTRIRYKDSTDSTGSYEYGVVASASNSSGTTTVTMATNSDYSSGTGMSSGAYSNIMSPNGYPGWFVYAPTVGGFSSAPANSVYKFMVEGRKVTMVVAPGGTSTSNTTSFTISTPITAATVTNAQWTATLPYATDNNAAFTGGRVYVSSNSSTAQLEKTIGNGSSWTASSVKNAYFTLEYEI